MLRFLGGAEEVGRLALLADFGGRELLFEYGFVPSHPPKFPQPAPRVENVFLTHCHLDHSGMLPWLANSFEPTVWGTDLTQSITSLLLDDTLKVWEAEGIASPYGKGDVKYMRRLFRSVEIGESIALDGLEINVHFAGHIPGAVMYEVVHDEGSLLFTGDINTIDTRLVEGTHPVKTDVLVVESTYAAREHPPRREIENALLAKVEEVVDRGGKALLPAFAVGRTQELMLLLRKEGYEIWLDGMGKRVNSLYFRHPEYIRDHRALLKAKDAVRVVRSFRERPRALKGEVVLTTSGMLDGGPILYYLEKLKNDEKSCVFLTGYQVEGTNGRRLLETGTIDVYGTTERVKCEVAFFDLSAHAGRRELLSFIRGCDAESVVLCHGDERSELVPELEDEVKVYTPMNSETLVF